MSEEIFGKVFQSMLSGIKKEQKKQQIYYFTPGEPGKRLVEVYCLKRNLEQKQRGIKGWRKFGALQNLE